MVSLSDDMTGLLVKKARSWGLLLKSSVASFMLVVCLFACAEAAHAFSATQCAADRFGGTLGCTSNDVSITSIAAHGGTAPTCVAGQLVTFDLDVTLQFASPTRYDVGIFVARDGNTSVNNTSAGGGPASCSVAILPTTSPFQNSNSNGCGDGDSSINGGTGRGIVTMTVTVPCISSTGNSLSVPFVVSWANNASQLSSCSSINDPVPGTTAKCNAPTGAAASVAIVVVPALSITDNKTATYAGDTNTYQIVISNGSGASLSGATFTDPAVANLNVSSVNCSAAGGATCPASGSVTVAAMQGAGIALPAIPDSGTLTFTVVGTVGAVSSQTTLANTAKVTTSGRTNSVSDTDTLFAPLTATKAFSPSAIAANGTSTLTIQLTNPNAAAINGVAFTDTYLANLKNTATTVLTNSCGGTATAVAGGSSLSLGGGTIPANGSCVLTVQVMASASVSNTIASVATTNAGNGSSVSAALQVISAANSTVVANPTSVADDGVSTSTITVTLKDTAGNPVAGKTVTLSQDVGKHSTITTLSGTTDANGQAIFSVKDAVAEAVTYTASDITDGTVIVQTASVTFSSISSFNAFETSTAASVTSGRIYTKLAGTGFRLDVVAIAGSSQATGFGGNVKVELLANTGVAGSGYGTDNCPTAGSVIQTVAPNPTISGGRGTVNFSAVLGAYRDVRVRISYPTSSPSITVCSNDSFAIRPSAVTLATDAIAAAPSASATPTFTAGKEFTLSATTSAGSNYTGTLTLDTSKLTAQDPNKTTQQSGGVVGTLSSPTSLVANPSPAPSGNASYSEVGYLYVGPGAYRDDTYTSVDQSGDCMPYTLVDTNGDGIPDAPADDNGDGIHDYLSDVQVNGKYGCSVGNETTVSLGRFIPDHFGLTGSVQTRSDMPAGSSFTYMDEPMKLTLTITAYNAAEVNTKNYAGNYAKLNTGTSATQLGTGGNWFCSSGTQCMGLSASASADLSNRLVIDTTTPSLPSNSAWNAGSSDFIVLLRFGRQGSGAPDGPYDALKLGAKPLDSDGVTLPPRLSADLTHCVDLDVTTGSENAVCNPGATEANLRRKLINTQVRFGRLWLGNAFGSDRSALSIPYQIQYWNGSAFIRNSDDSLSAFASSSLGLGNYQNTVTSANMGIAKFTVGANLGGAGIIAVTPPVAPAVGSVDLVVDLGGTLSAATNWAATVAPTVAAAMPYLRGKWYGATWDRDPSARATFGVFGSSLRKGPIYIRENF